MTSKPSDLRVLEEQALRLTREGQKEEAAKLYDQILAIEPSWEHGYTAYALAGCREDLGQITEARRAYEHAVALSPDDRIIVGGYSSFLFLHGKPSDAFEAHLRLLKIEAQSRNRDAIESTKSILGQLGAKLGLTEEAVRSRIDEAMGR